MNTSNDNSNIPFYYGLFPYIREKLHGRKTSVFIGWGEGIIPALFEDF